MAAREKEKRKALKHVSHLTIPLIPSFAKDPHTGPVKSKTKHQTRSKNRTHTSRKSEKTFVCQTEERCLTTLSGLSRLPEERGRSEGRAGSVERSIVGRFARKQDTLEYFFNGVPRKDLQPRGERFPGTEWNRF